MLTRQGNKAISSLLSLPWNTAFEECEEAIARAFLAACKHRAGSLPLVCLVVSQISKKYPRVGTRVS